MSEPSRPSAPSGPLPDGPAPVAVVPRESRAAEVSGEALKTDICVIGAGAAGLTAATIGAAFGRQVVLVEKQRMGGHGLNAGCVPAKALIASARRAYDMRTAAPFGLAAVDPQIDHRALQAHVRGVVASIAPNVSVERMTGLGIRVILGAGRFLDKRTLLAGDYRISARRFVIATGSAPTVPPIPGLEVCPYYTEDTLGEIDRRVTHLVVIGGSATGLELAQAYLRLGARVTVLEAARALGREEPEAAAVVLSALRAEGVDIREGTKVERVEKMAGFARVHVSTVHGFDTIDGSHLVVALGRTPTFDDLNLAAAGIKHGPQGITVNRGLRTSNRRIYAVGDVNGSAPSAHGASYQAEVAMKRALFWAPARAAKTIVPAVVMTDPELSHVGLTEDEARAARHKIRVLRWPFSEVDRAQIDRADAGHVKVVTSASGRVLGATIAGARASDLISIWALAVSQELKIKAVASHIAPYPTLSEASKRAAVRYLSSVSGNSSVRKLIDFLARFG